MSTAFKPLIPGSSPAGSLADASSSGARDLRAAFKPLGLSMRSPHPESAPATPGQPLHGPHAQTRTETGADPAAPPHGHAPKGSAAIARLIRDGDRITHIEVQCSCGELITLSCGYSPQPAS
jgi:hypothetical protein